MRIKKTIAGILALTAAAGMIPVLPASAAGRSQELADEIGGTLGEISLYCMDDDASAAAHYASVFTDYTVSDPANLPEKPAQARFDLRDVNGKNYVTPVRDQAPFGTCWAFAITAAAESTIAFQLGIDMNTASEEDIASLDFSERHLAWFSGQRLQDDAFFQSQAGEGLYSAAAEAIRLKEGFAQREYNEKYFNTGGNISTGTMYYSSYQGPVNELLAPYRSDEDLKDGYLYMVKATRKPDEILPENFLEVAEENGYLETFIYHTAEERNQIIKEHGAVREKEDGMYARWLNTTDLDWWDGPGYYCCANKEPSYPSSDGTWSVDESLRFKADFELQQSNILPSPAVTDQNGAYRFNEIGVNAVKNELIAGRAVSILFAADQSSPGQQAGTSFLKFTDADGQPCDDQKNAANWCHYTYDPAYDPADPQSINRKQNGNHCVTIIGYDDTIPKSYFNDPNGTLGGDGAFIVKNSWGTGWGNGGDGYFYLSYYDQSIHMPESFSFRVLTDEDLLENRYSSSVNQMYDLMASNLCDEVSSSQVLSMVNVFTADMNMELKSVGYTAITNNETVTYDVYLPAEGAEDVTSGGSVSHAEATYPYSGFQRTALDKPVSIREGQTYAVRATVRREDGKYAVGLKYNCNEAGRSYVLEKIGKELETAKQELNDLMQNESEAETESSENIELQRQRAKVSSLQKYYDKMNDKLTCVKGVVNEGESLLYCGDEWADLTDILEIKDKSQYGRYIEFDNFGIKAFGEGEIVNITVQADGTKGSCKAGDEIPCTVTVSNMVVSDLKNIDIRLNGDKLGTIPVLDMGSSTEISYVHTVTAEDLKAGKLCAEVTAFMPTETGVYAELNLIDGFSKNVLEMPLKETPEETPDNKPKYTNERLCEMSVRDYAVRHNVQAASAEAVSQNEDGTVNITLKDENNKEIVTYAVDPDTAKGTDSNDEQVNLPETGHSDPAAAAAAAAAVGLIFLGVFMMRFAPVRRRDEE